MLFHLDALLQAVDLQHLCHGMSIMVNKLI